MKRLVLLFIFVLPLIKIVEAQSPLIKKEFNFQLFAPVAINADTILIQLTDTLLKSTDFGESWVKERCNVGNCETLMDKMNERSKGADFVKWEVDGSELSIRYVERFTEGWQTTQIPYDSFDIVDVKNRHTWTLLVREGSDAFLMKTYDSGENYIQVYKFDLTEYGYTLSNNYEYSGYSFMIRQFSDEVYVAVYGGQFYSYIRSDDGGRTWSAPNIIYGSGDYNIVRFERFTVMSTGIGYIQIYNNYDNVADPDSGNETTIIFTSDSGLSWQRLSTFNPYRSLTYSTYFLSSADGSSIFSAKWTWISFPTMYYQQLIRIATASLGQSVIRVLDESKVELTSEILRPGVGPVTSEGFCVSRSPNPTLSDLCIDGVLSSGTVRAELADLSINTKYFIRSYLSNEYGTAYGPQRELTLTRFESCGDSINDIDGNIYDTVKIGNQCWMADNLSTTRFSNGLRIPEFGLADSINWSNENSGAWAHYGDDSSNRRRFGKLYNYKAIESGFNVCPTNWGVPTKEDWIRLSNTVGDNPGNSLKSTSGWARNNGVNDSGFNAYPAGRKGASGTSYTGIGHYARFWSTTAEEDRMYIYRLAFENDDYEITANSKNNGFSIRCILTKSSTVDIDESHYIPTQYSLHQNYPNPFNPTTQIRFALPESQQVSIQVYDINGRLVAELLNNVTYSAGNHQVTFDGAGLSSGIYIYRLMTGDGLSITRKLLLVK